MVYVSRHLSARAIVRMYPRGPLPLAFELRVYSVCVCVCVCVRARARVHVHANGTLRGGQYKRASLANYLLTDLILITSLRTAILLFCLFVCLIVFSRHY